MELVASCCFADPVISSGLSTATLSGGPEPELVELLLQLVTAEGGTTRTMSPFDDHSYIDRTPIIRSFLLQLLLRSK